MVTGLMGLLPLPTSLDEPVVLTENTMSRDRVLPAPSERQLSPAFKLVSTQALGAVFRI